MRKILKIKGSDLTLDQKKAFNAQQYKEFARFGAGEETLDLNDNSVYKDDIFYFLYEEEKLLALGKMMDVSPIKFMGKDYTIRTFGGVIATEKGKGYGKELVTQIRRDIEESGHSCFSFCEFDEFYRKCGFEIIPNAISRFTFEGQVSPTEGPHILCLNGKDNLIKVIQENPEQNIELPIPWW